MPNYRVPQYHRYHDSLISEYFWQLENVMDVLRGRAQHQQRFKEATLSTVFSVMQNAGTIGSTVSAAGGVVLGFLGQYQESRRVETLTPEYLSGQWEELKKMVETTAEKAVEQYRYFLERCSEGDAVELGRVSAQRLWEYIPREKLSFTIENMLIGILKGRSGRWQDDWRNTGLTESAESKRQTAEGALKHAGIAYCDENHQWHYALHPRDKDVVFPKYGFMLLPAILAKKRILEKKYIPFMPSVEQALLLDNIWSTSILESITEDSSILFSSLTPEVATRLQQLEVDWLSFCEWQDTVEERLEGLQTQIATHEIAIVEVKQNVVVQHAQLSRLQRNVIEISESRRFTYIPKPYFQPRKNLWRLLEQRFSQEKTMSPIAVVGSGGMGKTSLISQWAEKQKFSGKYHSIRRMVMDEISMEGSLVDLACDLSITVEKRKKEDWLKEVVQRLREQSWLIIWDNVENHAAIEFLLPYFIQNEDHNVTQHLVITSRDTTCWENPIMVDTFSSEESLAYIEHQMKAAANPWFNPQEAQKLANCFEHHPLALELAMGHVCLYQRSLDTYLQELQAVGISTLKAPGQKIVSQARINTDKLTMLWKMGLERLTSDAILLLRFMSFVGSQGVGRKLIINHFNGDEERCDEALLALRQQAFIKAAEPSNIKKSWAPIDETTGLMVIAGLEIPETSSEAWGIHRLIQEVVVDDTKQNWAGHWIDWKNFLTQAYSAIQITFPSETTNFNSMNNISLMRYLTYNRTFWYRITTAFNYTDATWVQFYLRWKAEFLLKFGTAESDFGLYEDAVKHLYEALSAYNSLGDDMPGLICVLTNLGNVHKHQGNHALALIFYNDSLIQARAFYGEKIQDSGIHIIFNNIGTILMAQRDYLNAIANFEQSIDVAHSLYGEEENYELVPPLINLAKILRTQGNHSRALELLESARHIAVVVFGGFSARPEISEILSELGHANSDQGQYAKACIFFTESLKNYRIYYQQSENHPNIAKALYDLAEVYSSQDNYSDAIIYHNRSLNMYRVIYSGIPTTLQFGNARHNLGLAYFHSKDYPSALLSFNEALTIYQTIYQDVINHIDIADVFNNIGLVCFEQKNFEMALKSFGDALTMKRAILNEPSTHPGIADTLNNMGLVYCALGNLECAVKSYKDCLDIYQSNPQNLNFMYIAGTFKSLGSAYEAQGDYSQAIASYQKYITHFKMALGENTNHYSIAFVMCNIGVLFKRSSDFNNANLYFNLSLKMLQDLQYSNTHPLVVEINTQLSEITNSVTHDEEEEIKCDAATCCAVTICCPCVVVVSALQCCGFFSKSSGDASHQTHSSEKYAIAEPSSNPLTAALTIER